MKNKKHDNPKPIRIAIGNLQEIKGEKLSPCELSDYDQHRHVSFSPSRSIRFSYNEHIINFGVIKDILLIDANPIRQVQVVHRTKVKSKRLTIIVKEMKG